MKTLILVGTVLMVVLSLGVKADGLDEDADSTASKVVKAAVTPDLTLVEKANKFMVIGKTTYDEAVQLLGKPDYATDDTVGHKTLTYTKAAKMKEAKKEESSQAGQIVAALNPLSGLSDVVEEAQKTKPSGENGYSIILAFDKNNILYWFSGGEYRNY